MRIWEPKRISTRAGDPVMPGAKVLLKLCTKYSDVPIGSCATVITSGPKLVTSSTSSAANGCDERLPRLAKYTCIACGPSRCESRSRGADPQVRRIVSPDVGMTRHGVTVKVAPGAVTVAEFELRGEVAVTTAFAPSFIGTWATPVESVTPAPPPL